MLWHLFNDAGWVKYPLGLCSILALAIILERLFTLATLTQTENRAFETLQNGLAKGGDGSINDPQISAAPVAQVMATLHTMRGSSHENLQQAADVAVSMQRMRLRRYLSTLATIGSTAPFIGLFGTVLGVLDAFKKIAVANNMEGNVVAGGIAEALSATAVGLLVAIPSVMAYNFLLGRVQTNLLQIQSHVARLMPYLETGRAAFHAGGAGIGSTTRTQQEA